MLNLHQKLIALLILAILLAGCQGLFGRPIEEEAPTPTPVPTPIVPEKPTYVVQRGKVTKQLEFTGRISPVEQAKLYFKTGGYVKRLLVEGDDQVQAGDLLAELEIDDLLKQMAQAKVTLNSAQLRLNEAEKSLERQIAQAKLDLAAAQAQLIRQFVVLPIVVAGLAFFAAATMIANTAALAAMERRREIGVMKAVGVRSGQILRQMLLESGIVGLVGGLIGVGLVVVVTVFYSEMMGLPAGLNPWPILALLALAVGTAIAATLVAAWPASRQRPLDVLRYE